MQIDLGGRLVFVTGAASGIGAAVAERLAAAGGRIIAADRRLQPAEALAARIGGTAVALDIAEEAMVRDVVATVEASHGAIDILVNCAGVLQNLAPPEALSMEHWDRITNIHQRGTYLVTVAIGSRMAARRRGSIVTIASTAGMRSTPLHAYAPAKAALISLTQCLATEWGRTRSSGSGLRNMVIHHSCTGMASYLRDRRKPARRNRPIASF